MNIARTCISLSVAIVTSTVGLPGAWASHASSQTRVGQVSDSQRFEAIEDRFALRFQVVAATVDAGPSDLARRRLAEAESQLALAQLHLVSGDVAGGVDAAAEALALVEAANDFAVAWRRQRKALDIVLEDVDSTLARARRRVVLGGFAPAASSTLMRAEHDRLVAGRVADAGRLQAARWTAEAALDRAVIAMEQATAGASACVDGARPVRATAPVLREKVWAGGATGSGGDVH